jgi:predicted transcriptional regulator
MRKFRLNIYLDREWYDALGVLAAQRRVSKSAIVEAAVAAFVSPADDEQREAVLVRRMDRMTRGIEKLDRDLGISTEAFALFMRYWLTITPPQSDAMRAAAKTSATERFAGFVEALGRRLAKGQRLTQEIALDIAAHPEWAGKEE